MMENIIKKRTKQRDIRITLKDNGQILYNKEIIAVLGEWNKYNELIKPCELCDDHGAKRRDDNIYVCDKCNKVYPIKT